MGHVALAQGRLIFAPHTWTHVLSNNHSRNSRCDPAYTAALAARSLEPRSASGRKNRSKAEA